MKTTIKSLRKEKGLTQVELATILHIDQTTISKWELGKALPDTTTLVVLAGYFDVSIDYLLGRSLYFYPDRVALPSDEKNLLENYRILPTDLQRRATAYMQNLVMLLQEEEQTKKEKKERLIKNETI